MFHLGMDLSDLEEQSDQLRSDWASKIEQLDQTMPQLKVSQYMEEISREFQEMPFGPLDDAWEDALRDLFEDGG